MVYFNLTSYWTLLFYYTGSVSPSIDFIRNSIYFFSSANELFVDIPEAGNAGRIPVQIDISVLNIACQCKEKKDFVFKKNTIWNYLVVGIDIQDDLGRHEVGFIDNTFKIPENDGAGCRLNASFKINRVPGNFHISTHSAANQPANGDMKHVIHELTFGDSIKVCIS